MFRSHDPSHDLWMLSIRAVACKERMELCSRSAGGISNVFLVCPHSCGGWRRCCRGTRTIWSLRRTATKNTMHPKQNKRSTLESLFHFQFKHSAVCHPQMDVKEDELILWPLHPLYFLQNFLHLCPKPPFVWLMNKSATYQHFYITWSHACLVVGAFTSTHLFISY